MNRLNFSLALALTLTFTGCAEEPVESGRFRADAESDTDANRDADANRDIVYDCSAIAAAPDWDLCDVGPDSCRAVFLDGAGCYEVCASVGLGCREVWENVEDECAPDMDRPASSCDPVSGHQSDYCVCGGPVGEPPRVEEEPSSTRAYEDLLDELVGFAEGTTGGKGGRVCTVSSTSNAGSGSLRDCIEGASGPTWVRFSVDGDIRLSRDIAVPSDVTVDARGRNIRIYEYGFDIFEVENVILTNLIFKEGNGGEDNDAVQIKGSDNIWIHHCSFSAYGDGLLDITRGSGDVTVSWNRFSEHSKVMLISANDDHTEDESTRVTIHHNWFRETTQRHPRVRHGKVHAFNNFFDSWGSYAMACSTNSECYSESNVFDGDGDEDAILTTYGSDRGQGEVESHNDLFLNGARAQERGSVFNPSDHYTYRAYPTSGLSAAIESAAGATL